MEKNKMIVIIVAAIAIIAAIAAAVVLTSGSGNNETHVTGVSLDKSSMSLEVGGTGTLAAIVAPSNASNKNVTWSTSNATVATVSNGTVKAVAAGSATITVTTADGGKTASCSVTVTDSSEIKVTGIALSQNTVNLKKGETATIVATVMPSDATNKNVTWSTADASVATVTDGVIKGVGAGRVDISATSADGRVTSLCHVTVVSLDDVSTMDKAILKVYGNANGDKVIDSSDVALIQALIDLKASVSDSNKIADANNDGVIDSKDIAVVNKIIAREPTPIWHINYFDQDSNGSMDNVLVETQFPINSIIMTGSSNSFMLLWMLGVTEEVKGACSSSSPATIGSW